MANTIKYLDDLNFIQIKNIEELKTSRGKVVFENNGQTSRLSSPDLCYYWDGERFGLHISNWDYYIIKDLFFILENENLTHIAY